MLCSQAMAVCISMWLSGHGYDAPHREAVLSYIKRESGFAPGVVVKTGACLGQWAGIRRKQILELGRGKCPAWDIQLEFMDRELRGPFKGFWHSPNPNTHICNHFGRGKADP